MGQGWVTSASQAQGKGLLEQRGLGDCVEAVQGLQFPGICPPLPDILSLHFPPSTSVLVAAGRHIAAANLTALLNILGRALSS